MGGLVHTYGRALSSALGIKFNFVAAGGVPEDIAAIRAGGIDAILSSFLSMSRLIAAGELRSIVKVQDHLPKPWANLMFFARKDLVAKDPEGVKKLITAYFAGLRLRSKEP